MRKVIVQTEMSLDGVLDSPNLWDLVFKYHNDEIDNQYLKGILFDADALLMGRVTYEAFAEVWPSRAGTDDTADRINSLPKFVASRTLKGPLEWNATLLQGDVAQEVNQLKQQPGQDIVQYGIGELTHTLLQHGLVDEMRFLVYPFVLGNGQRIFENVATTTLKLLDTKTFSTGAVALIYQPQKQE
jgi:dihydrofolate reductase